jgi:hypothetical protein
MKKETRQRLIDTATIEKLGGNQYRVQLSNSKKYDVSVDGSTIVSEKDWNKLDKAGLGDGTFYYPDEVWGCHDDEYQEVAEYVAMEFELNYSGFDVDEYIKENKE